MIIYIYVHTYEPWNETDYKLESQPQILGDYALISLEVIDNYGIEYKHCHWLSSNRNSL